MRTMNALEAIEYVRDNAGKLNYEKNECFAVRGDNFVPSRKFRDSWNRPDGVKTNRLAGVCACFLAENDPFGNFERIEELPDTRCYGRHQFLLRGDRCEEYGNDEWNSEVILLNHVIVAEII